MRLIFAAAVFAVLSNGYGFAQSAHENGAAQAAAAPVPVSASEKLPAKADAGGVEKTNAADVSDAAQTKLLADTRKLLSLTRELKAETAKCTPNTLSLGMIKKAEEIQRLAAVVRAEMTKVQ